MLKLPNLLKSDIDVVPHQGKFCYEFIPEILEHLTARTRLSISSKNSGIDVNQSEYFIVMEVSLTCWSSPTFSAQVLSIGESCRPGPTRRSKATNRLCASSVTQSINKDSHTMLHHFIYLHLHSALLMYVAWVIYNCGNGHKSLCLLHTSLS